MDLRREESMRRKGRRELNSEHGSKYVVELSVACNIMQVRVRVLKTYARSTQPHFLLVLHYTMTQVLQVAPFCCCWDRISRLLLHAGKYLAVDFVQLLKFRAKGPCPNHLICSPGACLITFLCWKIGIGVHF